MPKAEIRVFRDDDGQIPLCNWLNDLERHNSRVYAKCLARLLELEQQGFDMRRPHADLLRDGIYELRVPHKRMHYRMLYFFCGKNIVVVSHGLTKEDRVPPREIDVAVCRKQLVKKSESKYTTGFKFEE